VAVLIYLRLEIMVYSLGRINFQKSREKGLLKIGVSEIFLHKPLKTGYSCRKIMPFPVPSKQST
jgi:hypothetical protein